MIAFLPCHNSQMDYFVGVCIYFESITIARHKLDIYGDIQSTCAIWKYMQKTIPNGILKKF